MTNNIINFSKNVSHESNDGVVIANNSTISENFNNILFTGNVYTTLIIRD